MSKRVFTAIMMNAGGNPEGRYEFEADANLLSRHRHEILAEFMEHVDHVELPKEDVGYEVFAAFKNERHEVLTAMGNLLMKRGEIPFMVMISPKDHKPGS